MAIPTPEEMDSNGQEQSQEKPQQQQDAGGTGSPFPGTEKFAEDLRNRGFFRPQQPKQEQPQSKFDEALEKELDERRKKAHDNWSRASQREEAFYKLSPEEQGIENDRRAMRQQLQSLFDDEFRDAIASCRNWLSLRYLPKQMACGRLTGTNVGMRMIVSDEVSEDRYEAIQEISDKFKSGDYRGPSVSGNFDYIKIASNFEVLPRNLSECYWLLQFCRLLECVHTDFEKVMEKALAIWENPEELEFIEPFDLANNDRHRLLQLRSSQQYEKLDALLRKL